MPLKSFLLSLIKHDFFIWILLSFVSLLFSIVLCSLKPDDASMLIASINVFSDMQYSSSSIEVLSILFSVFFVSIGFIEIAAVAILFLNSKKTNFIDKISDLTVIKIDSDSSNEIDPNLNKIKVSKKVNYSLPGEIKESAIESIEEL